MSTVLSHLYAVWSDQSQVCWRAEWSMLQRWIRQTHREFVAGLAWAGGYNPLPLVMRAVNGLRLRWQSRAAPRWRRGRWRAKA